MINRIKKFVEENSLEIVIYSSLAAAFAVGAWTTYSAISRSHEVLALPKGAVKDLLAGKDVLVTCLEDAHLLIKYIPKI